ncbi:phage tail protein [Chitinophaga sp. sic0106]|uniref:phage tail protein n=1 Tax=Chitinophaga sp. sic0106 TaxID=2854785 RepID=UPI001C47D47A|nr:phage tail protein [Chitinophaga sp. sic0106]MBV7530231.1 phage tail protein [Chitinophaga sp. sic0106]
MLNRIPPVGFHFGVTFGSSQEESAFQEVSGLNVEMETEPYKEGGENRFIYQLPARARYEDLVLKRGLLNDSKLIHWCQDAIEHFIFRPVNITVSLLDRNHEPVYTWYVANAFPKKWTVSSFNAEESSIVVESLTLGYQFFRQVSLITDAGITPFDRPGTATV